MPGRKRKPAAQKDLHGNPGHHPVPVEMDFGPAGEIPNPPSWLDPVAKKEYRRIVNALADLDLLKATDYAVVSSYAQAFARWQSAEKQIKAEGTVKEIVGSQGQTKFIKHPALLVSAEAQKQMLRAGSLIGLNPVDRVKISASPKQLTNPFAALMRDDDD